MSAEFVPALRLNSLEIGMCVTCVCLQLWLRIVEGCGFVNRLLCDAFSEALIRFLNIWVRVVRLYFPSHAKSDFLIDIRWISMRLETGS